VLRSIIRRLVRAVVTLVVVSFLVFPVFYVLPVGVAYAFHDPRVRYS
jgi:ABC-type dipeptide/oligopeptide/nickel transport system permease component